MEGLRVNETRFEDAEGDERGIQEAQDQDRELQKMRMDFEETDAAPDETQTRDLAMAQESMVQKEVEQLYDPYLDPEGSRFINEHQI
jgi:hypothetical protein